ncbi:hypothetical protein D1872_282260 [compost metagenome]
MKLQVGMLPQVAALGSVDRGDRIKRPFAVQLLRPFQRLGKRFVAEFQQAFRRFRIVENIERQAVRFRIPKSQSPVSLPR